MAILWSCVNLFTATESDWSITKIVNIAAPTFFFASWLTAQYFRVRKQEHVSSTLTKIEDRVNDVMGRVERQTEHLSYITNAGIIQAFDECIFGLREAKEELADISRPLKTSGDIDIHQFLLHRGNPFYAPRRQLDMTVGYARHVVKTGLYQEVEDRYTRCSYHIEELAGHIGVFIGRLNHNNVEWKTKRSCALVNEICNTIEVFRTELLAYSKYASNGYKGDQNLNLVLISHIENLRKLCA